jgi:hypothetical protein
MTKFIEQHEGLLKFYCITTRILGWLLLLMGGIGFLMLAIYIAQEHGLVSTKLTPDGSAGIFLRSAGIFLRSAGICTKFGLLSIGASQFIRYLFDNQSQQGWLLRFGSIILWIFAIFELLGMVSGSVYLLSQDMTYHKSSGILPYGQLLILIPMILLNVAKALVLIGLAQILKRVMPVIAESRTLV